MTLEKLDFSKLSAQQAAEQIDLFDITLTPENAADTVSRFPLK